MLKNIEIKALKDFMAKSRDKVKVTNRQSVDMRKYECHWNHWSQKSVRLVELESDYSGIAQNPSNGHVCTEYRLTINILTK